MDLVLGRLQQRNDYGEKKKSLKAESSFYHYRTVENSALNKKVHLPEDMKHSSQTVHLSG